MKRCYKCGIEKLESEFTKDCTKKSGLGSRCKTCDNIRVRERKKKKIIENPEFRKKTNKRKENSKKRREIREVEFKLKRRIRSVIRHSFKRKGYRKNSQSEIILGINYEGLKKHFESLFQEGMNWDNMGLWHIDHIIPLSIGKNEQEIIKLCHYTNLQPLWEKDNLEKSNKIL